MEPLQALLKERYPRHTIGNVLSAGLLTSPLALLAYPCFLTLGRLGGILLKGYVSEYSDANNHELIIKIPGLPDRSFWDEGEYRNEVTFLKYEPVNNKGNGYYECYKYNIQTGKAENVAHIYIYGEKDMGIFPKNGGRLMFGHYLFEGDRLKFSLMLQRDKTAEFTWHRLNPEASQRIREIDRIFTESYLEYINSEALGIELSCGVVVREVIVAKSKIVLIMLDGEKYSISRDFFSWLRSATPDMLPFAFRDKSDKKIYIEWKELGGRIALENFTKI